MIPSEIGAAMVAAVGAGLMSVVVAWPSSASPAPAQPPPGDHDAFIQCMTDHGVPPPPNRGPGGPGGPGGPPPGGPGGPPPGGPPPDATAPPGDGSPPPAPPGVDQQTWDSAFQACASLAPPPPPRQ